jgi:hypothetical protein
MVRPYWLNVSDWLIAHHMGALEPIWLTLVGLWRSPYASLLLVLAVVLALNVAVIIYAFITPNDEGFLADLQARLSAADNDPTPSPTHLPPSPTPDRLHLTCLDGRVQIDSPEPFEQVDDAFSVRGTAWHPDMWHYVVELGYIGETPNLDAVPAYWQQVRAPPFNQSIPEPPVEADLLAGLVDLRGRPLGYYVVRLRIVLRDGRELQPCDVMVRH